MPAAEIKLVVFDWAGTTVDFGCLAPVDGFIRAFAAHRVEVTPAEARGPMGLHKRDHVREMLKMPTVSARWQAAHGREWTPADVEAVYEVAGQLQLAAIGPNSGLVPGLLTVVEELRRRGVKIAGTTGYFREAAEACYAEAKKQGYSPDFTICADEVPAGRPAPWMVFRAMETLGVYPPTAVVKVGDTVADMGEGRNAGAWTVGVTDTSSEMGLSESEFNGLAATERDRRREAIRNKFTAAGAHFVIHTLAELPALLDRLASR